MFWIETRNGKHIKKIPDFSRDYIRHICEQHGSKLVTEIIVEPVSSKIIIPNHVDKL